MSRAIIGLVGNIEVLARGKGVIVVIRIHKRRQRNLLYIRKTRNLLRGLLCLGKDREQDCGKNRDNSNNDEQLDKCKSSIFLHEIKLLRTFFRFSTGQPMSSRR